MTKSDAISVFGNKQCELALAIGVTSGAVSQWPNELPQHITDRVVGAAIRLGKPLPEWVKAA